MSVFPLFLDTPIPLECQGGALTIGNFDGVHKGHQALIREAREQAQAVGGPAVALTFDPHPFAILKPNQFQTVLTTIPDRAEMLHYHGADHVLVLRTTHDLLRWRAREFFEQILCSRFRIKALVEGFNFAFGHNREGTPEMLQQFGQEAGMVVSLVPQQLVDDKPVSSSRVRKALEGGAVEEARELLGRPYQITGIVGTGERRGNQLGFPTANLEQVPTLVPGNGVYSGQAIYEGQTYKAAVNIGPNPTFGQHARKIEAHLIDFQGNLYGQPLTVRFLTRLREVRSFAGKIDLIHQLQIDVQRARAAV